LCVALCGARCQRYRDDERNHRPTECLQ
jgi:hypothetical protein